MYWNGNIIWSNLLRESNVYEEELNEMPEHGAVQAAGLRPVEELLGAEPEGERGQVPAGHLPDDVLLLPAHHHHHYH